MLLTLHANCPPCAWAPFSLLQYCGESDLQLERINVYFNEATGGACLGVDRRVALALPIRFGAFRVLWRSMGMPLQCCCMVGLTGAVAQCPVSR